MFIDMRQSPSLEPRESTPNVPNQEINGMNACRRSPGMNALWHSPYGIRRG